MSPGSASPTSLAHNHSGEEMSMTCYDDIQTMDQIDREQYEQHGADLVKSFDLSEDDLAQAHELWVARAYNRPSIHVLYMPDIGRAGIVHGGDPVWTDAESVMDALERYFGEDDKEISNSSPRHASPTGEGGNLGRD